MYSTGSNWKVGPTSSVVCTGSVNALGTPAYSCHQSESRALACSATPDDSVRTFLVRYGSFVTSKSCSHSDRKQPGCKVRTGDPGSARPAGSCGRRGSG